MQYNLGTCFSKGTGVAQDSGAAARWYRLAADQGLAMAQYNLGTCFSRGTGVPKNSAEAARWLSLAADQGFASAQAAVAQLGL
jgi:TPR repeat protein